jgi:hypothetical protein
MLIQLKQIEIVEAIQAYVSAKGFSLIAKHVDATHSPSPVHTQLAVPVKAMSDSEPVSDKSDASGASDKEEEEEGEGIPLFGSSHSHVSAKESSERVSVSLFN